MKRMTRRILSVIPAAILQILWYYLLVQVLTPWGTQINLAISFVSVIVILYVTTKNDDGTYKILWVIAILSLPILGTVLYMRFGNKRTTRSLKKKMDQLDYDPVPISGESRLDEIQQKRLKATAAYVEKMTTFPLKKNTASKYYSVGEELFEDLLKELRLAKRYIFMEYFIIHDGYMWNSIEEILEQKAKEGVDVRVMYDDVGSISTFSPEEARALTSKGIRCIAFNPLHIISGTVNSRDHRKMTIIDGRIAFSGGINIGDEYINHIDRFGHWKDIGFSIKGEAVMNYTRMFVEFWDTFTRERIPTEIYATAFTLDSSSEKSEAEETGPEALGAGAEIEPDDGYILSYYDSPPHKDNISNELYIELLSYAKHTAYFYTPYLMLGDSLLDAFCRAAKRGVDVRIIMPGIPDKKLIFRMSKSFYIPLMQSGVKIYEYNPGFVHAKACIIDGTIATIGTVNLDYRSLFLHFENNSLFYRSRIIKDLERDFLETQNKCYKIRYDENFKYSYISWFISGVLRIISPLC